MAAARPRRCWPACHSCPCAKCRTAAARSSEFDLDAALARKPAVLLVDELAHSNAPGSRHAKRWQDVQELLDAGIDVWSALNVQHLESLNGTVGAITGVRVHETVPDTVLDDADEVVLVDVTPDELTARLEAGKVYLPQQAERAAQNFFRKGNLIALREIALRRTAEHVEDDVRGWRVEQSGPQGDDGPPAWNTSGAILACVGPHEGAGQTVRTAARLAGQLNVRWHAAYVETPRLQRLPAAQRDRILAVLKLAEELGAETAVLAGVDIAGELAAQAQRLNCATLVVGRPQPSRLRWGAGARRTPDARAGALCAGAWTSSRSRAPKARAAWRERCVRARGAKTAWRPTLARSAGRGYAWAAAASVAITLLAIAAARTCWSWPTSSCCSCSAWCGVAMRFGRGPAALAALLNVAAFDFFFVPPRLSFAVSDVQYLVTFAVMLVVGLLVGQLTAGLRFPAGVSPAASGGRSRCSSSRANCRRRWKARRSRQLGAAAVQGHFGGQAVVLVTDARDRLVVPDDAAARLRPQRGRLGLSPRASRPAWRPPRWRRSPGTTCR